MSTSSAGGAAESAAPTPLAPPGSTSQEPEEQKLSKPPRSVVRTKSWITVAFLLPAVVLLGTLVLYPIGYSVYRSLFDVSGDEFIGLDNYTELFSDDRIRTALRNNLIWVLVAPAVCTALGLIFAVLTEKVRWGTAFKMVVFMPMAISMLAAGVIFSLVYQNEPERGAANAAWTTIHDTFSDPAPWPGARPRPNADLKGPDKGPFTSDATVSAGETALLPLVAVKPQDAAGEEPAAKPQPAGDGVSGTVWLDFKPGGGEPDVVDSGEKALKDIKVEAVKDGKVVASATTASDGTFTLPAAADGAQLRLPSSNFAEAYGGVDWLGPSLVTPAVIAAYVWMWAGFAMVLIAAGLASVPRELMEAARVDGANEWQVFRRITVPVLAPVLAVVLVTLMINVLKIFDLVYIIVPSARLEDGNVLAVELFQQAFAGTEPDLGVGSAISVVLLLLVIPVMIFNIRRLRKESGR
ncbi:ABC transporter permease [Streptomyces sp. CNQ-509]|uniref:carbohydrate ABC transporter permease n=1 Tax=unclassified Streptomyces TaxID=2593676 RepID=UPI00062DF3E0|nr:sugar ABC transporter permease [Streptomyces sp. CNQ-509]AKH82702.1 ABC transporter permease [Streptomyces sp. CNQ-509]